MKYTYTVTEDNGGGINLFVFDESGQAVYCHVFYEFAHPDVLKNDIAQLFDDDADVEFWDGNEDNPQETWERTKKYIETTGVKIIADNDGIYHDNMGAAGKKIFGK
jgi:hypothetical protein